MMRRTALARAAVLRPQRRCASSSGGSEPGWLGLLKKREATDKVFLEQSQEARRMRNEFTREANADFERELARFPGATREDKLAALKEHRRKREWREDLKSKFLLKAYKAKKMAIWLFLVMYISYFVHSCSFMRAMDKSVGAY
eukprot:TRINITY_DN10166_c0_g1_i1.p2 TRINITY_DN10166_c0_g1~~TRINITY_DN10166_c0_g1_i1.p2  ORF type:complete len:143 (+),score=42.72 TRINITY_DN10166_c0_g1_i1:83-511(+)